MKKLLILVTFVIFLTACSNSDDITIPDGSTLAVCPQGDTFEYIYKDSTVYEFYTNGTLQSYDMKAIVQTNVDNVGTVREYLDNTFLEGVCTFTNYEVKSTTE
ncbi:MAG: hypothetical protein QM489_01955 [Candidatus Izemoplasma sp.]